MKKSNKRIVAILLIAYFILNVGYSAYKSHVDPGQYATDVKNELTFWFE